MKILNIIGLMFWLAVSGAVHAADTTVKVQGNSYDATCDAPTTRQDGTPLPASEIAGYNWYLDGVKIGTSTACAFTVDITGLTGKLEVKAETVDTDGLVSGLSVDTLFLVRNAPPGKPKGHR